jgi:hypothetical protein
MGQLLHPIHAEGQEASIVKEQASPEPNGKVKGQGRQALASDVPADEPTQALERVLESLPVVLWMDRRFAGF